MPAKMKIESGNTTNTGVIILAAGSSTRLGSPKQLLPYQNTTLLQHSLQVATEALLSSVVLVTGAYAEQIVNETDCKNVTVVVNKDWKEGMAASIRCGLTAIIEITPQIDSVILMLCDQPFVTSALLNELVQAQQKTGKAIVASGYDGIAGAPALFHHNKFGELLQLKNDMGARGIIKKYSTEVEVVHFSKGTVDIDTAADYQAFSIAIQNK
jgi:molybdenum cofactor cytidylyltransferase